MLCPSSLTRALLGMALAVLATAGCSEKASSDDCKALLDRVVEIEIQEAGTSHLSPAMKDDLDKQRKLVRDQLRDPFMSECQNDMPAAVVSCRLKAKTKADYAACKGE